MPTATPSAHLEEWLASSSRAPRTIWPAARSKVNPGEECRARFTMAPAVGKSHEKPTFIMISRSTISFSMISCHRLRKALRKTMASKVPHQNVLAFRFRQPPAHITNGFGRLRSPPKSDVRRLFEMLHAITQHIPQRFWWLQSSKQCQQ